MYSSIAWRSEAKSILLSTHQTFPFKKDNNLQHFFQSKEWNLILSWPLNAKFAIWLETLNQSCIKNNW